MEQNCCCLTKKVLEPNDPVPLKSIEVDVKIEGFITNVQSTLCYKNVEKNPIEARFEFPMDDQSAVYHFEARVEDRIIIAECQEKQEAKETYDEAMKQGYGAVLMQEDDSCSDIFSCLVGNLPPDAEAVTKFGYVTELTLQPDGTLTFLLPTLLNPRYKPRSEGDDTAKPPEVTFGPKRHEQPYKFDIKAVIVNPGKVVSVKAPKDALDVKFNSDKTEAQVTLAKPFVADHDLTLEINFEEFSKPHIIVEGGDKTKNGILTKDILMLNFFPELKETDYTSKHEFIFVIDRSGSMDGSRIDMAKETLLLFLKSLPPGCYFNIVGFGSTFELLFPEGSKEYSEATLKSACEHQKAITADLGGTEILEPLQHIYDKPPMTTHSREILLLTDGEVMNTQQVIDLVKKNATNTRLFSFGIGEGASTSLVKGIARAGKGKAEFTKEGERLQPLVMKTLKAAMQSAVTDLGLDWQLGGGSHEITQIPKELPPLFAGDRLITYALSSTDKAILDGKVKLKGKIGERSLEFSLDVDASKNISSRDETLPIHRLAAKAQIKQLQDAGKDENKASIVLLSTAANIISCHTSMVGVDKNRKDKVVGDLIRRNVPTMYDPTLRMMQCSGYSMPMAMPMMAMCRGMGGPPGALAQCYGSNLSGGPMPKMMRAAVCDDMYDDLSADMISGMTSEVTTDRSAGMMSVDMICDSYDDFQMTPEESKSSMKEPTYMDIVMLQEFSGLWKLNAELAALLNTTVQALQDAAPVKNLDVWATALALSYLKMKYADKHDEWEMVEMKARQWIDLQDRNGLAVDDLLQKAQTVICHV